MIKALVIGILILFIGMSVVSSFDNIVEDVSDYHNHLESIDSSEEILFHAKTAYDYIAYSGSSGHPEGPCYFALDNPGEITSLAPTESGNFLTGGTWVCGNRWIGIEYNDFHFWEIDPKTGDMWFIGYGGTGFKSVSYNPVNERLYVCCGGIALYEINMTKGERDLICHFTGEPSWLIGIAFDENGILYGWDDVNLWIINIENCEGTLVGPHGIDVYYGGYGHFDFDTDILYISTYSSQGKLYECDEDTGECTLVGNFEGGAEITALAIPYFCSYYPPDPAHDPIPPDGATNVPGDAILCWNGSDPDYGDSLTYDVYFSISYPPIQVSSNQTESFYDPYGPSDMPLLQEYYWRIVTWDSEGEGTSSPIWSFETGINYTEYEIEIDGPTRGKPGIIYCYNISINDYDGASFTLLIDWDDGTNQTEWYEPGQNITVCYCWDEKGTYIIRVKAVDQYGEIFAEGNLMMTIPRIRISVNSLFQLFFERFPFLEVFLRAMYLLR